MGQGDDEEEEIIVSEGRTNTKEERDKGGENYFPKEARLFEKMENSIHNRSVFLISISAGIRTLFERISYDIFDWSSPFFTIR